MRHTRYWVVLSLLAAIASTLAMACGSDTTSTPAPTSSPSATATVTASATTTATTTPSPSATASATTSATASPSATSSASPSATASESATASATTPPTETATSTATETTTPSGPLAADQTFNAVITGEPNTIDPQATQFASGISVEKQLFRGLLYYDHDLNPIPGVATEVPSTDNGGISADGKTYTFKLGDAKWSDGKPVTAQDFVYTVQRLCSPDVAGPYASFYFGIVGCEDYYTSKGTADQPKTPSDDELKKLHDAVGVSAPDDKTLVINLSAPEPTFVTKSALWPLFPVRQDVIEAHPDDWTEPGNIIGNGPFVLDSWDHNTQMAFKQNPNWWGEPFTLQNMVWKIIEDENQEYSAYLAGELDQSAIPIENVQLVRDDPTLSKENVTGNELTTFALEWNNTKPPFDNVNVRKAFATAIDRVTYIDVVRSGVGAPAYSWIPPGMPGYNPDIGKEYDLNPEKAKQYLADAGFPNGEGLPPVTITIAESATGRATAQFVQEQLKQNLGIDVEIEVLETATYEERYGKSDFQVVIGGWGADYADPENWLPQLFGTGAGNNQYKYSNPKVDDIFKQAASELDNTKRLALYDQAQKIIVDDDAGIDPLFYRGINFLRKPYVQGEVITGQDGDVRGDWFFTEIKILEH